MNASFVYITASDKNEALRIGRALVEDRLAACVNIIENMTSLYWWDDEVQEATEAILIAKTQNELVDSLIEQVTSLHSYDCACVVSWPIAAGNPPYLQWIEANTQGPC